MSPNKIKKKPTSAKQDLINNTPKLIGLLETKPLLWDTSNPYFYNLPERAEMWRDVTRQMFTNFDECDEEEQKEMILQIKTRWRHVRTAYVRQKKVPNLKKVSYIYDKEMAFYSNQGRSTFHSFNGHEGESYYRKIPKVKRLKCNDEELSDTELEHNVSIQRRCMERKSRAKSIQNKNSSQNNSMDEICNEILQESGASNTEDDGFSFMYEFDDEEREKSNDFNGVEDIKLETYHPMDQNSSLVFEDTAEDGRYKKSPAPPMVQIPVDVHELVDEVEPVKPRSSRKTTVMKNNSPKKLRTPTPEEDIDDDQCFFDSLKPALRDLNEDDKMDFRIEVMSILRDLKRK